MAETIEMHRAREIIEYFRQIAPCLTYDEYNNLIDIINEVTDRLEKESEHNV